jgi:hypothetical protein
MTMAPRGPQSLQDGAAQAAKPALRAGGKPLAPGVRRAMEARLGHSFADVRVHSDASEARALGARAFASGTDVVFAPGELALGTPRGRALLAHELAHVVQQRGAGDGDPARAEAEASSAGRAVARGRRFAPRERTGPRLARQEEGETDVQAAEEGALRAERPAEVAMFKEEQLSFARERITATTLTISRDMADLRKHPEAERPALRMKIFGLERELADALGDTADLLVHRIADLEARAATGERLKDEIATARRELNDARADLDTLKGAFSPEKGAAFEDTYKNNVAGLHCMGAAYAGLGALTTPERSAEVQTQVAEKAKKGLKRKHKVNLDQFITVMDTAHADNIAGPKQRAAWSRKRERWSPTLESLVRARVNASVPGFYFFGFAVAEAFHSVLIGVSTWDEPRTLWCDQYGCTEVPGNLDDYTRSRLKAWEKAGIIHYHDWDSYVWQVLPPAAASVVAAPGGTP